VPTAASDVLILAIYGFLSIQRYTQCYSKINKHPHPHSCTDVKIIVFVTPRSPNLEETKERVVAAVSIIGDMLQGVCDELGYTGLACAVLHKRRILSTCKVTKELWDGLDRMFI
jgi:hypothetical protein